MNYNIISIWMGKTKSSWKLNFLKRLEAWRKIGTFRKRELCDDKPYFRWDSATSSGRALLISPEYGHNGDFANEWVPEICQSVQQESDDESSLLSTILWANAHYNIIYG